MLKRILIIFGALSFLILVYGLTISVGRFGKTKVSITVVPEDSQILVDEQPSEKIIYLSPGEHTFAAKHSGFKDDTFTKVIGSGNESVGLIPTPDSDEARAMFENDPDLQAQREAIGGLRANEKGMQIEEQTPLIRVLPITDINGPFSIDYGPSETRENGTFIEISDSSPESRVDALKWIRRQGEDPTNLEIRYSDFVNPLAENGGMR